MSAPELTRLRARYAKACADHRRQRQTYQELRSAVHDELRHEIRMMKARADLRAAQDRVHRDCQAIRDTFAMGAVL